MFSETSLTFVHDNEREVVFFLTQVLFLRFPLVTWCVSYERHHKTNSLKIDKRKYTKYENIRQQQQHNNRRDMLALPHEVFFFILFLVIQIIF